MADSKKYQIPFKNGNLVNYCTYPVEHYEWVDNYEFEAKMEFVEIRRGRSAAGFIFRDKDKGKEYYAFMKTMQEIFTGASAILNGVVEGRWSFVKRGPNYGLEYLGQADQDILPLVVDIAPSLEGVEIKVNKYIVDEVKYNYAESGRVIHDGGIITTVEKGESECAYCEGTGNHEGKHTDSPCTYCQGSGKPLVEEKSICTYCNGSGGSSDYITDPCYECGGTGRWPITEGCSSCGIAVGNVVAGICSECDNEGSP